MTIDMQDYKPGHLRTLACVLRAVSADNNVVNAVEEAALALEHDEWLKCGVLIVSDDTIQFEVIDNNGRCEYIER